jgi:hypothetical protein
LDPLEADVSVGIAQIPVSAVDWISGETHALIVEGQDAGGNWSPEPIAVTIEVVENVPISDCFALDEVWPLPDTPRAELSTISLVFNRNVDTQTVGSASIFLQREGAPAILTADYDWLVHPRVLQLSLAEPMTEAGAITLTILPTVTDVDGLPYQSGGECTGVRTLRFVVQPPEPGDPEQPGLDELDEHGRILVDAYQLELEDVVGGEDLRIYDTAGRLLLTQRIEGSSATIDTRQLGKFPARLLLVVYREHRQMVMIDGSASYGSYLK